MQHGFGERIDLLLQKSVRAASRIVKERQKEAREKGMHQEPPSFEEFNSLVSELMETGTSVLGSKLSKSLGMATISPVPLMASSPFCVSVLYPYRAQSRSVENEMPTAY